MSILKDISAVLHTRLSTPLLSVKRVREGLGVGLLLLLMMTSCSESDNTYDPYDNWEARNAAWFVQITDSARAGMAQARAKYGDAWRDSSEWLQFKSLQKSAGYNSGNPCDSICVHVRKRGTGTYYPLSNDTVRLCFRGWLMSATYHDTEGRDTVYQSVFTQTYYGAFNEQTAAPSLMPVSSTVEGFSTALQYMRAGDIWDVYIPQQLGYGSTSSDAIPAYSTLLFRIYMAAAYRSGSGVPDWK